MENIRYFRFVKWRRCRPVGLNVKYSEWDTERAWFTIAFIYFAQFLSIQTHSLSIPFFSIQIHAILRQVRSTRLMDIWTFYAGRNFVPCFACNFLIKYYTHSSVFSILLIYFLNIGVGIPDYWRKIFL